MSSKTITTLRKLTRPHLFLLQNCTTMKELMTFHAHFITTGLANTTLVLSTILSFTALSPAGNLPFSHLIFNTINSPNTFMYNTMIRCYASSNSPTQAISMYTHMLHSGVCPNNYTFPFLIKASSRIITDHSYGEIIHGSIIKSGHVLDLHIANSLLHMYASFGFWNEIVSLFDEMPEPDLVSWNVVIDNLAKNGHFNDVLIVFDGMWNFGVDPNSVTVLGLISSCSKTGDLRSGRLIHSYIIRQSIHISNNLENGLLDMYAKFGDMVSVERLFARMKVKTVFSWTSLIDGLIQKGELERGRVLFNQMPEKDTTVWNVMLNGFTEAGDTTAAEMFFRTMTKRDLVSWNSMIVGYGRNKNYIKSFEFFREMLVLGMKPDRITLASVFSVCGFTGALDFGEGTHCYMEKLHIKGEEVEVALVDMYCKCGTPKRALKVFDGIFRKSVLAWSSMIVGLATNGLAKEALDFFHRMQIAGIKPNEITFIGVLCACSYAGLVEEGKWLFNAMSQVYGVQPRSEHFGCMVDILGRAGLLNDAEIFVRNMPIEANAGIWGAVLGACRMHGEVQMGERIAKIITEIEPNHSGRHVLLSNIYATEDRWFDAEMVRKNMKNSGVHKTPGFSLIELKVKMHQFLAGEASRYGKQ